MAQEEIEVTAIAAVGLPDGAHSGTVQEVEKRSDKFEYLSLHIAVDGTEGPLVLKCDYPVKISEKSALGKVVEAFTKEPLKVGHNYKLVSLFDKKKVKFTTITEETDRGTFSRIVNKSLRPA